MRVGIGKEEKEKRKKNEKEIRRRRVKKKRDKRSPNSTRKAQKCNGRLMYKRSKAQLESLDTKQRS